MYLLHFSLESPIKTEDLKVPQNNLSLPQGLVILKNLHTPSMPFDDMLSYLSSL